MVHMYMIASFKNKLTEKVFQGKVVKQLPQDIQRRAQRKLVAIDNAVELENLADPPGNKLKPLSGDRDGQHSIRVNDQWRICFIWSDEGALDVEITDYH